MERRWHPRKAVALEVTVAYGSAGMLQGCSRDLSLEGMYIETPAIAGAVPYHSPVEIRFRGGDAPECRVPALVVRTEANGLAVMYRNVPIKAQRVLQQLLAPPR